MRLGRAAAAVAVAGAACFGWGLLEARMFTLRRAELAVLPRGSRPIRVLHLSDIHLLASQRGKLGFLRSLAALRPDVVVNTGDNIAQAAAVGPLLDAVGGLLDVPGVFVFGSNDYYAPRMRNPLSYLVRGQSRAARVDEPDLPWERIRDGFSARGWVDLTHRRAGLEINGTVLSFRGTDDAHLGRDDYRKVAGPASGAGLRIAVTHAPYLRLLEAMTADGVDLIFAGHTHGGQVCVPGYGAVVTNCDLDTSRVKGLSRYRVGRSTAHLHVSAGLGTSPWAPYRFSCRPEVTLLTLLPSPDQPRVGGVDGAAAS